MSTTLSIIPYGTPTFVDSYMSLDTGPSAWLIDRVIPRGGVALLYGAPKTGKSMIAMELALAITQGQSSFMGFAIPKPGKVLYLQLDTPRSLWQERLRIWEQSGIDLTPHASLAIEDRESAPPMFNVRHAPHASWLAQAVATVNPDLVIVDVWRECFRGDENDSDVSQHALSSLLHATSPAATLILAHGKKPPADPSHSYGIMDEIRGSSHLPGAVDTVLRLRCREGDELGWMALQGRALEFTQFPLKRNSTGLWYPAG